MASIIRTSFSFRLATVAPSLLEFTSRSENSPFMSGSLGVPLAEFSMFRKMFVSVTFRFSSSFALRCTFWNSSDGRMKYPFSCRNCPRAFSASASSSAS